MPPRRILTTCTRDCPSACGLRVTVEEDRITAITGNPDHPHNQGQICTKTRRFARRLYHPERVVHPLARRTRQSPWQRISWDQALDAVAMFLSEAIAKSGPHSICYYQGNAERTALKLLNERFFNHLGGVTTIHGSLCSGVGPAGQSLDVGSPRISHDPLDHRNSKAIVLWGRNPVATNRGLVGILQEMKGKETRILLVDPCRTESAVLASRHIAPAPGRDACLAMAAIRLVLDQDRQDAAFIREHTDHFDALRGLVMEKPVEEWAIEAGVSMEDVRALVACYLDNAPCATLLGWGCLRYEHGHLTVRSTDALGAITGNLGVPGGGVSQGFEEYGPYDEACWGRDMATHKRSFHVAHIGEEIANATDPGIELFIVSAANPVTMSPDSFSVMRALSKVPKVVHIGHFLDDTSVMADIFLPATMFLEQGEDAVASYGHHYVGPLNQCVEPQGQCLENYEVFRRLSRRFDFHPAYDRPRLDWLGEITRPLLDEGHTLEALQAGPVRWEQPAVPYAGGVFHTANGRFQCLDEFSLESLPPRRSPEYDYPFQLLSISPMQWLCSELTLADQGTLAPVYLHPDAAARLGLVDGQQVLVESETGSMEATLLLDDGIREDVARLPRGGWLQAEQGVNTLTKAVATAVGGGTAYYETAVRVRGL